jgi:hypothetical protein
MLTTEQVVAAHAFLVACEPANALRLRQATQNRRSWQDQLQAAQADRRAARLVLLDVCGTRAIYKEAIAVAQEKRKLA